MLSTFKPAPHQVTANVFMKANKCTPLFYEMGCYKTSTVINHCEDAGYPRVLICCLKDNLKTWADQFDEWTDNPDYTIISGTAAQRLKKMTHYLTNPIKYLVINYEALGTDKLYQLLKKEAPIFDHIAFDEAYSIHNHTVNKWRRWYNIRRKISRCTVMDGDPTAEGEIKIFGIYKMMDMGATFGNDYYVFLKKYFFETPYGGWLPTKAGSKAIKEIIARTALRVEKKDVLDLPPVVFETIYPELQPQQKKLYNEMAKIFSMELDSGLLEVEHKMTQLHKLKQIVGGFVYEGEERTVHRLANCKAEAVRRVMKANKKLVIWCAYEEEMQIVKEISIELGRTAVIHKGNQKEDAKRRFKELASVNDFIGGADGGIGLNELVVASTALYYSRSDKRRSRSQSIARLDRPGQQGAQVTIIDLVVPKTLDEATFKRLKEKGERSAMLLNYNSNKELKEAINGKV
jgi:SNF2 family DNA or RNA helicase